MNSGKVRSSLRDMTAPEIEAVQGMMDGDVVPLAALLEQEEPDIHPIVQRYMVRLLSGSADESDYRLKVITHPDLKSPKQGRRHQLREQAKKVGTAMKMAQHGALREGHIEAAISATKEETGLDRATIFRHWKAQKDFIRFCIAHGHLELGGDDSRAKSAIDAT